MICCAAVAGISEGCGGKIGRLNGGGGSCTEVREEKMGELVLVGKRAGMGGRERKRTRLMGVTAQLSSRFLHNLTVSTRHYPVCCYQWYNHWLMKVSDEQRR